MNPIISISEYDPSVSLDYILNTPEGIYLERKSAKIDPKQLSESIVGMLNAEGGIIVVGIQERQLQDILTSLTPIKVNDLRQVMSNFIAPPCNIFLEELIIDQKTIFIYHIQPEFERVFKVVGGRRRESVYLRCGDQNEELGVDEVRNLEYDKNLRSFEDLEVRDFDESDLKQSVLGFYANKMGFEGDPRDLLVNRNLAKKDGNNYIYKNSAILLIAKNPEKYIPSASIRYIRFDGTYMKTGKSLNVVKDERWDECIPRCIELLKKFLNIVLKDYFFLDLEDGRFKKIPEYPEAAWLEGIVNALTHRSYNLQGNVTTIKHFDDRLEISNSGPLPSQITIDNIRTKRYARNPRLARALYDFGYVRELNEGVSRIFETMQEQKLSAPEYIDKHNIVTLTLKNDIANSDVTITDSRRDKIEKKFHSMPDTSRRILFSLLTKGKNNAKDLANELGMKERTVSYHIKKLVEDSLITRHAKSPRDPDTYYTI